MTDFPILYESTYGCDELYHHGIKGQKWGIRRFQNNDGSLTAAGKRRYNETDAVARHEKKSQYTDYNQRKKMSDEELIKRIGRLEKEKRLIDLEKQTDTRAHKLAADILKTSGKVAVGTLTTAAMVYGGKKTIELVADILGADGTKLIKEMFPKKK